ncbi:MAG: glycosyltransferase family 4 protein [Rhodospirillales bacterium]|nr:glycosyltransferase family 4 protein [Rhodospirillales bacterium]
MSKARPILLIANNFPPVRGGSAVVYDNLARGAGGRIIVLAPSIAYTDGLPTIGWREHDRMASYRVIRLPLLRTVLDGGGEGWLRRQRFRAADLLIRLRLTATLLRLIRTERVGAVCVGELIASSWIVTLLAWLPGIRSIAYVHGEEITTDDGFDPTHRRAHDTLRAADQVVVVSRFTLGAVRALVGEGMDRRITLIENGVDTRRFRPQEKRADLLEEYRLQDCFVFVAVCRLLEKKGIDHAIRAFARVVATHPDCRFLVVGTGAYEAALRACAREEGVAAQVVFAGDVAESDLVAHYCLGDTFVMPNRELPNGDTEGFGLVFLEANSCGVPVIAGRDGGSRDAVQDGVNGLVVNGHSVDDIAAAMGRLREDAGFRESLRRQGLAVAAAADWSGRASAFLDVCDRERPVRTAS